MAACLNYCIVFLATIVAWFASYLHVFLPFFIYPPMLVSFSHFLSYSFSSQSTCLSFFSFIYFFIFLIPHLFFIEFIALYFISKTPLRRQFSRNLTNSPRRLAVVWVIEYSQSHTHWMTAIIPVICLEQSTNIM